MKKKKKVEISQGTAGGAATAAGVGFQERVAAFAMTHTLLGLEDYSALGLGSNFDLRSIHLETAHAIDDIMLVGTSNRALIQAKRSLSLSDSASSGFSSALRQFVQHHLTAYQPGDRYVLATGMDSSSRIVYDLRKMTESVRLNSEGPNVNPLTIAESEVVTKTRKLISYHLSSMDVVPQEGIIDEIFSSIWILPLDLGAGGRDEFTAITLLRSRSVVDPKLIWDSIITLAAHLAESRASVDFDGLLTRFGQYFKPQDQKKTLEDELKFEIIHERKVASGREVVVFDGLHGTDGISVVDFHRFSEDGSRRLKFVDDECTFLDGSVHKYLYRSATFSGVERFLKGNLSLFKERKITLFPSAGKDNPNEGPWALARQELIDKLIRAKAGIFRCIVCGNPVSEDKALLVEVDEEGCSVDVGYAHTRCHRPSLRVGGELRAELFAEYVALKDFDYQVWILANKFGPGLLSGMPKPEQVAYVGWKPALPSMYRGDWCIRLNLDDGSSHFVTERGKVQRFSHGDALTAAQQFSESFKSSKVKRDPWCVSSKERIFGTYSSIARFIKPGDRLIKCRDAEPVRFSPAIDSVYSSLCDYYAPLTVLLDRTSGRPLLVGGMIILLSKPFDLVGQLENWTDAGMQLADYSVGVIESDADFDALVMDCHESGLTVVIDPVVDMTGALMRGFIVERFEELLARGRSQVG